MSRPKSPRTLMLEAERTARREERELRRAEKECAKRIREERRALKLQEKETKSKEWHRRKAVREYVRANGVSGIKQSKESFGIQVALAHNPCDGCNHIVGNAETVSRFCGTCCYSETRREGGDNASITS